MIAAMIGDFGFLRPELQDVFEVKVVDAVLDSEPEDVGIVVTFHLFYVAVEGGVSGWGGGRE